MNRSAVRRRVAVPSVTTRKSQSKDYQYTEGIDTNSSNDDVSPNKWRYVTDARENQVGKWDTRKGNDLLSIPIGEVVNVQQASVTVPGTFNFSNTIRWAKKLTATSTARLTALEANIRNSNGGTGTIVYALYSDNAGSPGTELVRTTVSASSLTAVFQYLKARSITCPDITNATVYWVVGYVQAGGTNSYTISTTTNTTTGKMSTDGGVTWTAANVDFNVKLSTATTGGTKGTIRFKRTNGTSYTFIAHGTTVYSVNETTGVATSVDTGISALSTYVRFDFSNDVLRYVDGIGKPRKYDLATSTASQITTAPEAASAIIQHKVYMFYLSAADPNKAFYSDEGYTQFDVFNSTNFEYFPAPKTADPAVAFSKLQGSIYVHTRNNKYIYSGYSKATFQQDNAIGQKGTFSQESVVWDEDYVFLASDDGIYRFNGAEETNITTPVLNWWMALTAKQNTVLQLHNNRLYIYYTPNGQAVNSRCMIYNILYGICESDDTRQYIGFSYASSASNDNYLIAASNRVGMLMLSEQITNDYTNMGEPLTYELRTAYNHYDSPAQYKRATEYRPHFDSVTGSYSITVGYATDYSDAPSTSDVSLASGGVRFDTGVTFDSGSRFGGSQQINPMDNAPNIPGEWRRLQLRYKHDAAREPCSFDGHVINLQVQRLN